SSLSQRLSGRQFERTVSPKTARAKTRVRLSATIRYSHNPTSKKGGDALIPVHGPGFNTFGNAMREMWRAVRRDLECFVRIQREAWSFERCGQMATSGWFNPGETEGQVA